MPRQSPKKPAGEPPAPGAPPEALGAVLAGGESRRMGRPKAHVLWEGHPLVVHVARLLETVVAEVIVVTKRPVELAGMGLTVVSDRMSVQTPLAGIATALHAAAGRPAVIVACDMPRLQPRLIRRLLEAAQGHDAAVPVREGRLEPLHAVWCAPCLGPVTAALDRGRLAPHEVLAKLDVARIPEAVWRVWDPEGVSMLNVNTPEDLQASSPGGPTPPRARSRRGSARKRA
ncbi:MAG: molybdenum cofactor guanylyltransferase [Actinomycetota bacterium]